MPDIQAQSADGVIHSFPNGTDPAVIDRVMKNYATQQQSQNDPYAGLSQAKTLSAPPPMFSRQWFKEKALQAAGGFAEQLPAIGGTLGAVSGGVAGTPAGPGGTAGGAISGSMLGGAGGEAGRQLIERWLGYPTVPQSADEAAKRISRQGLLQGSIQTASEALPFLAGPLQRAATSQYERALAPTTKINKAITQDITPELLQRGEYGSLENLEKRAGQKISQLNPQLNQAYQGAGTSIPGAGTEVIQDLENLKQSYMPGGNVAQPQAVSAIEGVQNIIKQYGPDISLDHLRRLRQIFEEVPAQRGAYAGADLSTTYTLNAQQQAADSIRGILNKNPDIGALNKEISFWLDVQRVTSQSGLRRTGQEGLARSLYPLGAGAFAGATGYHFGGPSGLGAGAATALTVQVAQIMRSPAWRTASAVAKDRLADALARGDVGAVSALAARFGAAALNGQSNAQSPQVSNPALPWLRGTQGNQVGSPQ